MICNVGIQRKALLAIHKARTVSKASRQVPWVRYTLRRRAPFSTTGATIRSHPAAQGCTVWMAACAVHAIPLISGVLIFELLIFEDVPHLRRRGGLKVCRRILCWLIDALRCLEHYIKPSLGRCKGLLKSQGPSAQGRTSAIPPVICKVWSSAGSSHQIQVLGLNSRVPARAHQGRTGP